MINKILLICIFLLSACSTKKPAIDPDRIVTRKETKLAVGEINQTLNVTYQKLFPMIQEVFANRRIPLTKVDSNLGKIVSAPVEFQDRTCGASAKSSVPLNCEATIHISAQPYRNDSSRLVLSYTELCDGLEYAELKCPDSNAEKLMLSIVSDIKRYAGVPE